jgi:hypothetical protein
MTLPSPTGCFAFYFVFCVFVLFYVLFLLMYIVVSFLQGDQKVSMHLMITIQKITSNVQSVIPNSDYVIMVGDSNCLKHCIFACFFVL